MRTKKIFFIMIVFLLMGLYGYAQEEPVGSGNHLFRAWKVFEKFANDKTTSSMNNLDYSETGFFVGYVLATAEAEMEKNRAQFPKGVTYDQIYRVVGKYLEEHPESLHLSAYYLAGEALRIAFFPKKNPNN
jgi:hypothetical protein